MLASNTNLNSSALQYDSTSTAGGSPQCGERFHSREEGCASHTGIVVLTMQTIRDIVGNAGSNTPSLACSDLSGNCEETNHDGDRGDSLMPPSSFQPDAINKVDCTMPYFSVPANITVSTELYNLSEPQSATVADPTPHFYTRKDARRHQRRLQMSPDPSDCSLEGSSEEEGGQYHHAHDDDINDTHLPVGEVGSDGCMTETPLRRLATSLEKILVTAKKVHNGRSGGDEDVDEEGAVMCNARGRHGQQPNMESSSSEIERVQRAGGCDPHEQHSHSTENLWWFREMDCHFDLHSPHTSRHGGGYHHHHHHPMEGDGNCPGVLVLNGFEQQFVMNMAFHCPVKPVATLFIRFIRRADHFGLLNRNYRGLLLTSNPSLWNAESQQWMVHRVPPPSLALTELTKYLNLLDAACGCAHIPRPLGNCKRMHRAAVARSQVLSDIFLEMGEVSNYYRVLSTFPEVLQKHHNTMQTLLLGEGPLTVDERFMVAIMAASRHRCEYLFRRFAAALLIFSDERSAAEHFLSDGPLENLRELWPLIALAAHVPWSINGSKIAPLVQQWSIPQLMHAACIIVTVLPLSGLVTGLAVQADVSTAAIVPKAVAPFRPIQPLPLYEKMSSADDVSASAVGNSQPFTGDIDFLKFCGRDTVVSERRINRGATGSSQQASLNEATFSWQETGGTLVEQYYPGFADYLTDEMGAVEVVTRLHPGGPMLHKSPDIAPSLLWRSIRLYLFNLIGIVVDDFAYQNINNILTIGVKKFVQKSAVYPERLCLMDLADWATTSASSQLQDSKASAPTPSDTEEMRPIANTDDPQQKKQTHPSEEEGSEVMKQWFEEEVTLVLVALVTFETRREGLLLSFLSGFSQFLKSM